VKPLKDKNSFTILQLRVLINGGNANAKEFFEMYDIQFMSTQKKYATHAAAVYRERLKQSVEGDTQLQTLAEGYIPDYETARLHSSMVPQFA
jgi:hypothetical protein